ncbi:MAG: hypothetical protein D6696_07855, partial [Acidobacteria bacterium]
MDCSSVLFLAALGLAGGALFYTAFRRLRAAESRLADLGVENSSLRRRLERVERELSATPPSAEQEAPAAAAAP